MAEATQTLVELHRAIWETLSDGLPVVVTSHVRLDGDGIGSALALWHALQGLGIRAYQLYQPPVPAMFEFLPGVERRSRPDDLPDAYHLVVLDCGSFGRIGEVAEALTGRVKTVNIDHHVSNNAFGDVNYVDPSASSCGELIRRLLAARGAPLTPEIAVCIYAAIVSDTGQFSHQNTSPEAFEICAECVRAGVAPHEVVRTLFLSLSPAQVKLRHLALGTLLFHSGGRIATMEITEDMFERTGLTPVDTDGFAELAIAVQGVEASALLKEMPDCNYVKVSMRSKESVDVCRTAKAFGGGGHTHAAGCEIDDTLENVRRVIVSRLAEQLDPPAT